MQHPEFAVHSLNEEGIKKANEIRNLFDELLTKLSDLCPPGREYSLVKTKLEEASFFAKKSMAGFEPNQK